MNPWNPEAPQTASAPSRVCGKSVVSASIPSALHCQWLLQHVPGGMPRAAHCSTARRAPPLEALRKLFTSPDITQMSDRLKGLVKQTAETKASMKPLEFDTGLQESINSAVKRGKAEPNVVLAVGGSGSGRILHSHLSPLLHPSSPPHSDSRLHTSHHNLTASSAVVVLRRCSLPSWPALRASSSRMGHRGWRRRLWRSSGRSEQSLLPS
jgi:hypothetical protein